MDKAYFDTMKSEIKLFRERMKAEGEKFFLDMSKELFEQNPGLIKFGWKQYTPYFNDGDPCEFSAHLGFPNVLFRDESPDYDSNAWLDEEPYFQDNDKGEPSQIYKRVVNFLEQFDDDDVEMFFGDHCQVVVSRNGIEVEEYEHD